MEYYFEVPFYRDLTKSSGWDVLDPKATKYQVARAIFKVKSSQLPGPVQIGRKFEPFGAPSGVSQDKLKVIELESEVFAERKTIERSIVESQCMSKVLSELTSKFGDGKLFNIGGKAKGELSATLKECFQKDFHITNTERVRKTIRYEFRDTVSEDCTDILCGATVYQKCRADLYLLKVDFLTVEYRTSKMGLRKKLVKYPFPTKGEKVNDHPNIIHIGVLLAELHYWEMLPMSSVVIKDKDYVPEVEDDSEVIVNPPRESLIDRPYWSATEYPTLYQLANVAFPYKWVNKPVDGYTREELIKMELGEAEYSDWWFRHGPGSEN